MTPDAVIKHDKRSVAFDAARLESSIAAAALGARDPLPADAASRLAREVVESIAAACAASGKSVVTSAEIRVFSIQALRDMSFENVTNAYQLVAREAFSKLQRVRVIDDDMPRDSAAGSTWDRRRLVESLRASGIASEFAYAAAREVERRVIALGQEFVSPALIHALASLVLPTDAFGMRVYSARRIAYSAAVHVPHFDAKQATEYPLPSNGPALEAFWIQAIHSADAVRSVRDNLISLDPCPSAASSLNPVTTETPHDPLSIEFPATLRHCFAQVLHGLNVRADGPDRIDALGELLARIEGESHDVPYSASELNLYLKSVPKKLFDTFHRAAPVTINAGGLVAREALRDVTRTAARLGELASIAARIHREREEYFLRSPVRGRVLPIAVTGLWNATAWIQGGGFDTTHAAIGARDVIAPLCNALHNSVANLRKENGMELVLTASAPLLAERRLWRNDRGFFLDDGQKLNAASAYESAPESKLSSSMDDFINRLDFAKAVGEAFDEPPALTIAVGLSPEIDAVQWKNLLDGFAQAGVACLRLAFGNNPRTVPNLTRAIRSYSVGFPLLDPLASAPI